MCAVVRDKESTWGVYAPNHVRAKREKSISAGGTNNGGPGTADHPARASQGRCSANPGRPSGVLGGLTASSGRGCPPQEQEAWEWEDEW